MLRSKGGANFFVICHSDFQKIKAHAAVIAEEIGSPFGYNEIPLDNASQEGLNLIDLAIDDEEHNECGENWTSKLSINLRHCVKVRKNSPSEQVHHALALGGLFSDTCPSSNTFNLKWPSRKSRSKRNSNHSVHMKPSESIQMEKDEVWGAELDRIMVRREGELIQYSRRFKSKPGDSAAASKIFEHPAKHMHNEVSVTNSGGPDESSKNNKKNYAEKSAGSLSIAVESTENFDIQRENQITEEISMKNVAFADDSEGQCNIQSDGDVLMKEAPDLVNTINTDEMLSSVENCSSRDKIELENTGFTMVCPRSTAQNGRKRRIDVELQTEDQLDFNCFIKSPCERLRPRAAKDAKISGIGSNNMFEDKPAVKSVRKSSNDFLSRKNKKENKNVKGSHRGDLEGCLMKFQTKADLLLHKRNQCPHKGCGKKFSSHKHAVIHQRVHDDDRPLKCPWKGCTMTFKWAWARTEHLRVHTGERPYQCKVEGCGLTFRVVSDFSRHRRKTGHYVNVPT